MNRIDRLFGILTLLQSRKYITAEKISERFCISIRTVYRDVKALQEQGIPVGFEQPKGYFLVQGYFLPPVSFNMDEANALLLVESLVNGFADNSIRSHYVAALTKVKAVLKTSQKEKLEMMNQHIKLQVPDRLRFNYEYLSLIQQAISERNMVALEYKNAKDETSKREVEPIGLIFYAFSWHLIAWCHFRNQYRDFNLTRIISLQTLNKAFLKTEHMPLSDYMSMLPVNF
ncbi:YafY family protein [Pedobacter sp. Leaf194]|uniref:helix-turn-helix transcriptional regulator n=1 Tax=Pedobacter sp. Leaf194 TaxID=1736297 RepID=UPI000702AC06|nr:YafY family protein [Pedobacter sp. Leaf194]KQS35444.1 DNA-binding transcriptional regulator [Pedobacter sp. Leaf194]RYD78732.1 MAG: YafY family transcriptional regulator [Sphingobacteriales bacterium]